MRRDPSDFDQAAIAADLETLREHLTIGRVHLPMLRKGVVVAWAFMTLREEADANGQPTLSQGDLPHLLEALTIITRFGGHERHRHADLPFDFAAMLDRLEAFRTALVMKAHDDAIIDRIMR